MTNEREDTQPLIQDLPESAEVDFDQLTPEEQVAVLQKDLQEIRLEVDQNKDIAQRAQAELVNYRKRSDEERISLQQYSNSRLIMKMLPVFDELELAVNHADQSAPSDSWVEGVKLIQRKVASLLESEGVSKIDSVGIPFDPAHHEAVGTDESAEYPPGFIIEVVRNGYLLHGRLIQPAQVVVAR
ncbi:MAG: nucleotide exchange factor GrpE [Dehalococcoidia bacterium]